eukprot:762559-Hanusia_phi.AAC.13
MQRGADNDDGTEKLDGEYHTYPSQRMYANGATMCTSACYVLACAFAGDFSLRMPATLKQMDIIMQTASWVHAKLVQSANNESLFSVYHVIRAIHRPKDVRTTEVMGTVKPLPADFPAKFDDENDDACLVTDLRTFITSTQPGACALITLNFHTTLVLREQERDGTPGHYWHFDPLVAHMRRFRSVVDLMDYLSLTRIPARIAEFSGLLVARRQGG